MTKVTIKNIEINFNDDINNIINSPFLEDVVEDTVHFCGIELLVNVQKGILYKDNILIEKERWDEWNRKTRRKKLISSLSAPGVLTQEDLADLLDYLSTGFNRDCLFREIVTVKDKQVRPPMDTFFSTLRLFE